jgi:uncharacterized protein YhdP
VDVGFSFSGSHATVGKLTMENMSISGRFSNHLDSTQPFDDQNSKVELTKIQGILNELPMEGRAVLTNLADPSLQLDATFDAKLKWLNLHLDTTQLRMTGGHFTSSFSYSGKLSEYLDENRAKYQGRLSGKAGISKGSFQYLPRKVVIDRLNATFKFTESRFEIEKMALRLNKSPMYLRGRMTDFVPFFTTPGGDGKVTLDFHAPRMDLSQIVLRRPVRKSDASRTDSRKRITAMVERLSHDLALDVNFSIKEFINKGFKASHANGRVILGNNKLVLRNARMEFADGTVQLDVSLNQLQADVSPFVLEAKLQNVDLKEFFRSFKDFNQTTIRSEHVDGHVNMNVKFNAALNNQMKVLTSHLQGQATFSLRDGKLTNFEPMQKLSNFLFKGRDFSNVQFGQIHGNIGMQGTAIDVQRMEVQSTALTMFVEGKYDLVGHSDLSIQIPLSNLQKRDQHFAPENIGVDAKVGASVFLRVRPDKNGETAITYEPFGKFRKK